MKDVQRPGEAFTFCGHAVPGEVCQLEDLEGAAPGTVCPACLGQVMEHERDSLPDAYRAYVWAEKHPRILSETFPTLPGVWAYRLTAAQLLSEQGDSLRDFQYAHI